MAKWLAGAIALLVLVVVLWMQIRSPGPDPVVAEHVAAPAAAAAPAVVPAAANGQAAAAPAAPEEELDLPERSGKIDPRSDEFFNRFDEVVPRALTSNAAKCYEGRHGSLHRNQKLSLRFKVRIRNGEVTIRDVTIKESTLSDAALETCFIQEVARSSWKDDELPDWEQDDELVLRPERGMKKFWRDQEDARPAAPPA